MKDYIEYYNEGHGRGSREFRGWDHWSETNAKQTQNDYEHKIELVSW